MIKKLQYSPDAIEKLHEIKQDITIRYGEEKAKSVIREMTKAFRDLQQFESKGPSVENHIGIPVITECRMYNITMRFIGLRVM